MKKFLLILFSALLLANPAFARPTRFAAKFAATQFTPKSLANLSLWLDASDASTITIATGISQWRDKSGNGNNASQGVAGNQPTYVNTVNSKSVITFGINAAQKYLTTGSITTSANTVVSVFKHRTANYTDWEGVISARGVGLSSKASVSAFPSGLTGNALVTTTVTNVGQTTVSCSVDGVPGLASDFDNFNFGLATTPPNSAHIVLLTDDNVSGAEFFCIGADTFDVPGTRHFDGDIAELIVYDRALSSGEQSKLIKYLKTKWGIL